MVEGSDGSKRNHYSLLGRDNKLHFQGVTIEELKGDIGQDPQFKQVMDKYPDLSKVGIKLLNDT